MNNTVQNYIFDEEIAVFQHKLRNLFADDELVPIDSSVYGTLLKLLPELSILRVHLDRLEDAE